MGNSSYEVKENDKVHVVKNNISESKLDPTSTVDQVAITNNNNLRVHFMVQVVRFAHVNNKNWIFDIKITKNVTHIWMKFLKK